MSAIQIKMFFELFAQDMEKVRSGEMTMKKLGKKAAERYDLISPPPAGVDDEVMDSSLAPTTSSSSVSSVASSVTVSSVASSVTVSSAASSVTVSSPPSPPASPPPTPTRPPSQAPKGRRPSRPTQSARTKAPAECERTGYGLAPEKDTTPRIKDFLGTWYDNNPEQVELICAPQPDKEGRQRKNLARLEFFQTVEKACYQNWHEYEHAHSAQQSTMKRLRTLYERANSNHTCAARAPQNSAAKSAKMITLDNLIKKRGFIEGCCGRVIWTKSSRNGLERVAEQCHKSIVSPNGVCAQHQKEMDTHNGVSRGGIVSAENVEIGKGFFGTVEESCEHGVGHGKWVKQWENAWDKGLCVVIS